jgi:hypothetical protein
MGEAGEQRRNLRAGLVIWSLTFLTLTLAASPAVADVRPLEVREYRRDFDVSSQQAQDALQIQSSAAETDVVSGIEARLGSGYAGVWFDNGSGEFVVPVLGSPGSAKARGAFAAAGLEGDYRAPRVESSWADLEAAQEELGEALSEPMAEGLIQTSIDPRTNSVVVRKAEGVDGSIATAVREQAEKAQVAVRVETTNASKFRIAPVACHAALLQANCDAPLRAGVPIGADMHGAGGGAGSCSAGFKAIGIGTGNRYVLTAGHCARYEGNINEWSAYDHNETEHSLGPIEQAYWGTSGYDVAKIRANGSPYWDISPWPSQLLEWESSKIINSEHPITSESKSYVGEYACFTGATSGTGCGYVRAMDVSVSFEEHSTKRIITVSHLSELYPVCNAGGNSGGPVYSGNSALGITSFEDGELPECQNVNFYTEIMEDTDLLGVVIAPRITTTDVSVAGVINGTPGSVTVNGHVYSSTPVNNAHAYLNFSKLENGSYVYKNSVEASVSNSYYEVQNWQVGPGTWRVKTVFPAQGSFAGSESPEYGNFTVKSNTWYADNLGGIILRDPDISSWGAGRLDVFALGADGKTMFHKWYDAGAWSGWEQRGTNYSSGPGAVSWGPGRIDVVARSSDGSVRHEYWDGAWHSAPLGGYILEDPDISSWGSGRLDIFALGADGKTFFHRWFTVAEGWSAWEARTTGYSSGPSAVSWGPSRIDVVGRATDGSVAHEYFDGSWHKDNLGGETIGTPDISSWGPGRLDVFTRGNDGKTLWHKWFTAGEGWSAWEPRTSGYSSGPGAVSWGPNRIDVVGRATDGSVKHEFWAP